MVSVVDAYAQVNSVTVELKTELDLAYWGLTAFDFYPTGKVYYETSTSLLDHGSVFASSSSGHRVGPSVNVLTGIAEAEHTVTYLARPPANPQLVLSAEVRLMNLPEGYRPPAALGVIPLEEPGIMLLPVQFTLPILLSRR
jgi:hypothetical protein